MATDLQQHQRMWQGIALDEDFYGRLAASLMGLFRARGFVAAVRRRRDPHDAWGPSHIAYQCGCDPMVAEPLGAYAQDAPDWLRPQGSARAIGGVVTRNDTCQVRLSLLRGEADRPFGELELQLGEHLRPLLEGAIATRLLLQAREQQAGSPAREAGAQPWTTLNLTRAEEDVLELLLQGYGVKQISQRRRSSYHTVRSQLASLLSKANCHSQRELILRMKMH